MIFGYYSSNTREHFKYSVMFDPKLETRVNSMGSLYPPERKPKISKTVYMLFERTTLDLTLDTDNMSKCPSCCPGGGGMSTAQIYSGVQSTL